MGTGFRLPYGSWGALLGKHTSVSCEDEGESFPGSPAHQNPERKRFPRLTHSEMHVEIKAYELAFVCVCVWCVICGVSVWVVCVCVLYVCVSCA